MIMIFRKIARLSLAVTLVCSLLFSVNSASASSMEVRVIAPAPGTVFNPLAPFTLTLRLVGGTAAVANNCYDEKLDNFKFGGQLIDENNRANSLTWAIPTASWYSTGMALKAGWNAKLIPNGIECTLRVGKNLAGGWSSRLEKIDNEWFGTESTGYYQCEDSSLLSCKYADFGKPQRIVFAWSIDGGLIQSTSYNVTADGTPTVVIDGFTRGEEINYQKEFKVVTSMDKNYPYNGVYIWVKGLFRGQQNELFDCFDSRLIKENSGQTTKYIETCILRLWKVDFTDSQTIEFEARVNSDEEFVSQSVAISVGKIGVPILRAEGTLVSLNAKKPWTTPANLTISGIVEAADGINDDSEKLPNAIVKICLKKKCREIKTDNEGKFGFNLKMNASYATWTVSAKFAGYPVLVDWSYDEGEKDSEGSPIINEQSALPPPPIKPATTRLRVSISTPTSVIWGDSFPMRVSLSGNGSASCYPLLAYPNIRGAYTPAGSGDISAFNINGGSSIILNTFLPFDLKSRWYIRMICRDNKTGAYLPWGESFISNR